MDNVKYEQVASGVLPGTARECFSELFQSNWLNEYHHKVGDSEMKIGEWNGKKERELRFRRKVGFETEVLESQKWIKKADDQMIMQIEGFAKDAPFSKSYRVLTEIVLKQIDKKNSQIDVRFGVKFLRRPLLAGQIEFAAKRQARNDYITLVHMANKKMENNQQLITKRVDKSKHVVGLVG